MSCVGDAACRIGDAAADGVELAVDRDQRHVVARLAAAARARSTAPSPDRTPHGCATVKVLSTPRPPMACSLPSSTATPTEARGVLHRRQRAPGVGGGIEFVDIAHRAAMHRADEAADGDDLAADHGNAEMIEAARHRRQQSPAIRRRIVFVDQRHRLAVDAAADHIELAAERGERDLVARRGQRLLHGPDCPSCASSGATGERKDAAQSADILTSCPPSIRSVSALRSSPAARARTKREITAMPCSLSLRQGIAEKFSPPLARKISAFSTAISSSVSRQSAEKPGVTTARFFTPRCASASTVLSV